ncbi:AB-hydrolase YheT [Abortiporus biennis]|nr:AB-hydrolase YheT [Abortiporus biennis]
MGSLFSFLTVTYYLPKLFFAEAPAAVTVRRSLGSKELEQVSLRSFVQSRCTSLLQPFRPAWWLPTGHLQTAYCVVGDFSQIDKVEYDRTLLRTLDGGTIGLDFTPPTAEDTYPPDTPVIVVLHGLTGGSHESYVRSILAPACTPVEKGGLGYRAVVMNFRGCAGVPMTSPQLYSGGHTDDIRVSLMYIAKKYPQAPLHGIGFSLGANVLTRYLAQEGEHSRLSSGCVLGCPWNLLANSNELENRWLLREVYSRAMAQNLTRLLQRHVTDLSKFPDSDFAKAAQTLFTLKKPTLMEFDNTATRVGGGSSPPFPFDSAHDYYVWASSHDLLPDVRVPLLAMNADDDPIVQKLPIDEGVKALSPWVVFALTNGGGHLGWFERGSRWHHPKRWVSKPVLEWMRAVGRDFVPDTGKTKPINEVDGFLKEEGRDDIGCKEVEHGEHIIGVEGEEGMLAGL